MTDLNLNRMRGTVTAATVIAIVLTATTAHAFCLARQCDPDAINGAACAKDAVGCSVEGLPLRRTSPCLAFGVASGSGSLFGFTDLEFEQTVSSAFSLWANARCAGGPPGFAASSVGPVASAKAFACATNPANNLDVWHISNELPNPPVLTADTGVVAGRTTPSFTLSNGLVFDADVDLNRLWLVLHNDDPVKLRGLARTIAAHEAGHALGLAHSQDPNSLMFRSYKVTPNRTLSADDEQGVCALFPPRATQCAAAGVPQGALDKAGCDAVTAMASDGGGCSMARPVREPFSNAFFAILSVGLWLWSERRRRRI